MSFLMLFKFVSVLVLGIGHTRDEDSANCSNHDANIQTSNFRSPVSKHATNVENMSSIVEYSPPSKPNPFVGVRADNTTPKKPRNSKWKTRRNRLQCGESVFVKTLSAKETLSMWTDSKLTIEDARKLITKQRKADQRKMYVIQTNYIYCYVTHTSS